MSLQLQLDELTARLRAMVPADRLAVVDRTAEELVRSQLAERALKVGDQAPHFELPDGDGMLWRSEDLLRNGPAAQRPARHRLLSRTLVRLLQRATRGLAGCP